MHSAGYFILYLLLSAFLGLFNFSVLDAQSTKQPLSSVYTGFGAYSFNHADVFSSATNQAALAQLKQFSAGVFGEKRFLLNDLGFYQLAVGIPTPSGNFGINTMYLGYSGYNEMNAGIAYGRKLGEKLAIGAQFNYYAIRISGYGNASTVSAELGAVFKLTEKFYSGIHVFNPAGGKFGKNQEEQLASVYTMGFGYEASEKFFTGIEIIKEENLPVNVNAGFQYKFLPQLMVRAGFASATPAFYFGVGVPVKKFRIDATAFFHQQLGVTPGVLLIFPFNAIDE